MKIDGHCHCGEITFEAEVDPDALNICHYETCMAIPAFADAHPSKQPDAEQRISRAICRKFCSGSRLGSHLFSLEYRCLDHRSQADRLEIPHLGRPPEAKMCHEKQ